MALHDGVEAMCVAGCLTARVQVVSRCADPGGIAVHASAPYRMLVGTSPPQAAMDAGATSKTGVLFVCLGNICRSPTAEAMFRAVVERAGVVGSSCGARCITRQSRHSACCPPPNSHLHGATHNSPQRCSCWQADEFVIDSCGTGGGAGDWYKPGGRRCAILAQSPAPLSFARARQGARWARRMAGSGAESVPHVLRLHSCSYHEGDASDERMAAAAARRGVKLTSRSRPLRPEDLSKFDYIIGGFAPPSAPAAPPLLAQGIL